MSWLQFCLEVAGRCRRFSHGGTDLLCAEAAQARCAGLEQQRDRSEQEHKRQLAEQASLSDAATQLGNQHCREQDSKVQWMLCNVCHPNHRLLSCSVCHQAFLINSIWPGVQVPSLNICLPTTQCDGKMWISLSWHLNPAHLRSISLQHQIICPRSWVSAMLPHKTAVGQAAPVEMLMHSGDRNSVADVRAERPWWPFLQQMPLKAAGLARLECVEIGCRWSKSASCGGRLRSGIQQWHRHLVVPLAEWAGQFVATDAMSSHFACR